MSFAYQSLLGRAPNVGALAAQVGFLGAGGSIEQLIANIVGSPGF